MGLNRMEYILLLELDTLMNDTREQRTCGFISEYCPVCGDGHLNRNPLNREMLICSLCNVELAIVGDTLEELNPQANDWAEVTQEVNAIVDSLIREERETLTWELPEEETH